MNLLRKISGFGHQKKEKEHTEQEPHLDHEQSVGSLVIENHGGHEDAHDSEESGDGGQPSRSSLFKLIQSKIGMDVSQGVTLPVWLFEPTTTLQRLAEMVHFADLLNTAADLESSVDRIAYVAAFFATGFSGTERFFKPFNPVLGETFEFIDTANNFRFVSEQVSHHPPIAASHVTGDKFLFWQESSPKTVFLGNSLDLMTGTRTHIVFPRTEDHFVVTQSPHTRVHNLLIGRSWIDHYGLCTIVNRRTNDSANITFQKCGFLSQGRHALVGHIHDSTGKVCLEISGKWNRSIELSWLYDGGSEQRGSVKTVWSRPARNAIGKFRVTEYVMRLNELTEEYERLLPPTDSRIRPDRRLLERGDMNGAGLWKHRLEEKQRSERKQREKNLLPGWRSAWFHLVPEEEGSPHMMWQYAGGYWEQRAEKQALLAAAGPASRADTETHLLIGSCASGTACDFQALLEHS